MHSAVQLGSLPGQSRRRRLARNRVSRQQLPGFLSQSRYLEKTASEKDTDFRPVAEDRTRSLDVGQFRNSSLDPTQRPPGPFAVVDCSNWASPAKPAPLRSA